MVVITKPIDEELEKMLQETEDHFVELKAEVTDARKSGRDTFFVDTKMLDFPSLVKMARATYDKEDVLRVKHLLQDLRHEFDVTTNGTAFEHALTLISEANFKIVSGNIREARATYSVLTDIYKALNEKERSLIIEACTSIRERLMTHEE